MSIINITKPYHDQNDHHIKLIIVYQKSGPLFEWFKKGGKMPKIDKGPQLCQNYDHSKS